MEAFPHHLAQGLSSQVEQDSQPAFALFRWEQQRSQRRIKNKPLQAFLLHGCSQPQWVGGVGHFIPPHGAARGASSSSEMETSGESVWEYQKRWEEMLFFPLSSFNPGRQQAHNILWRKLTLYQPNPVPLISPPSSTSSWQMRGDNQGEWKGGIKGKALFSVCRAEFPGSSLTYPLLLQERSSLAVVAPHQTQQEVFQCPSKMFTMMLCRAILLIPLPLTPSSPRSWPWTASCADKGQWPETSKLRKEKNCFLYQRKLWGLGSNNKQTQQKSLLAAVVSMVSVTPAWHLSPLLEQDLWLHLIFISVQSSSVQIRGYFSHACFCWICLTLWALTLLQLHQEHDQDWYAQFPAAGRVCSFFFF